MKKFSMTFTIILLTLLLAGTVMAADQQVPMATIEAFAGEVQIGQADSDIWAAVEEGMDLFDGQIIKTGSGSQATIHFGEGEMITTVGENIQISLQDLLLKAKLEKARGKVVKPAMDEEQTKIQVTPLTGVRGTEQAEGKAEELKRQHHWEENVEGK